MTTVTTPPAATPDDRLALAILEHRLKLILPEQYQDDHEVLPTSMGSAGLKYDSEGRVAWNEVWGSFCDLAMAGGPPHKGHLLSPGSATEIAADPDRYRAVLEEIGRGIVLVTGLGLEPHASPGWIRVGCRRSATAGWLARAITMENVAVRVQGALLDLPVSPSWQVEKEVKNVITVIAKTCHYWAGHTSQRQQQIIANLFATMEVESPLLQPNFTVGDDDTAHYGQVAAEIARHTGIEVTSPQYTGWLGLAYPDVSCAIWTLRALVASNVLARREGTTLFVPLNAESDPGGERLVHAIRKVRRSIA